jgi:hypothetical protein
VHASVVDAWPVPAAPVPLSTSSLPDVLSASTYAPAASSDNLGASPSEIALESPVAHGSGGATTTEQVQDQISAPALDNSIAASTQPRTHTTIEYVCSIGW